METKNLLRFIFIPALSLIISACTKSGEIIEPQDEFSISQDKVVFSFTGDPVILNIYTKHTWVLDIPESADWIEVSSLIGSGNSSLILEPSETEERKNRGPEKLAFLYNGQNRYEFEVSQDFSGIYISGAMLATPENNTEDISLKPELTWALPDNFDGEGKVTYTITISEDRILWDTVATELTDPRFEFSDQIELKPATKYYWRVIVEDEIGHIGVSKVYSFTTDYCGYYREGEVRIHTENTADADRPIHLIFMGDGFLKEHYAPEGEFDRAVDNAVEAFFGLEPYITYSDYFKVSKVAAYSPEEGATVRQRFSNGNRVEAQTKNTAFSSVLDGGNSTGISCDYRKVFDYARMVEGVTDKDLENTTVILLINLDVYAGTCIMMYDGKSVSMCPVGQYTTQIVMHEAGGHGFGRLLDEYRSYNTACPQEDINEVETWRGGNPWYFGANISFSDTDSHWHHYLNMPQYSEDVDYFEGANLYYRGAWRPEFESCMETNIPYYNAPSREAIVMRILKGTGGTFDREKFLELDVHQPPGYETQGEINTMNIARRMPRLAPPVLIRE